MLAPPPLPEPVPQTGQPAQWYRRFPRGERITNPNHQGLIDLKRWPAEPKSPDKIDEARFVGALTRLCPRSYRRGVPLYSEWILKWSREFKVDPFTVAALTYYRSNCRARFKDNGSFGLAAINLGLHAGYIKKKAYGYWVRDGKGGWKKKSLKLGERLFYDKALLRAEPNIYFTAGILRVMEDQCPGLDSGYGSIAHRHPVSHFFWGDRVRGTDMEDRVLTARRRLLEYYAPNHRRPTITWEGLTLNSPLDGGLRKITSKIGDDRDEGGRRHQGIDFGSDASEPVYAIAPGRVILAGPQLKRSGTTNMPADKAVTYKQKDLGAGGLVVFVKHNDHVKSAYMHLSDYAVMAGDQVTAGQLLGWVGRTGVKTSPAHLHFEIRVDDRHVDPLPILGKTLVISPMETWRGQILESEQKRVRRKGSR